MRVLPSAMIVIEPIEGTVGVDLVVADPSRVDRDVVEVVLTFFAYPGHNFVNTLFRNGNSVDFLWPGCYKTPIAGYGGPAPVLS